MSEVQEYVSLKDLAVQLGIDRSNCRKFCLKLGLRLQKRVTPDSRGALSLVLSAQDAEKAIEHRRSLGHFGGPVEPTTVSEQGWFYVIQLVPELDPRRVKLGFASDVPNRLQQHKTAAPTARVVKQWACKRTWEFTAMDCLVAGGCRLLLNEVFECDDIDALLERGDAFFAMLPHPDSQVELSPHSPLNT